MLKFFGTYFDLEMVIVEEPFACGCGAPKAKVVKVLYHHRCGASKASR